MRLKSSSQPLVFCFPNVSALCNAVGKLYDFHSLLAASLCCCQNKYYLAVHATLRSRRKVYDIVSEYGVFLGPGSVRYAYFEEHGFSISHNAVAELGAALRR